MKGFQAILVSASFVVVVFAIPKPQDGVSPEDILNNDAKYNKQGSSGNSDQVKDARYQNTRPKIRQHKHV